MLLFWAVTMCICFDFRPPIGSCTSVNEDRQLSSPVSTSYNPPSRVPLTFYVGEKFCNTLSIGCYYQVNVLL